ncbi:response regulator, partial [bacterium]
MPGMDGWTVLSKLKADPAVSHIPVVMLTMMDDVRRGYALGASGYITKPTDRKRLAQILKEYSSLHSKRCVLLVDDDAQTRQMLRSMLEISGWLVIEAENVDVALNRMAARPNLILIDLSKAEGDGLEFAETLRRSDAWHSIPVVLLADKELSVALTLGLMGGVHTVLDRREWSREELTQQMKHLLEGWVMPASSQDINNQDIANRDLVVTNVETNSHV